MSVTTTSLRQGKFEARFWHRVFEEEVGRVKGHFGPLNTYVGKEKNPFSIVPID
jgi:translation initiation factor 3 subunit I